MKRITFIICAIMLATGLYGQEDNGRPFSAQRTGSPATEDATSLRREIEQLIADSTSLRETNAQLTRRKAELEQRRQDQTSEAELNARNWRTNYGDICDALLENDGLMLKQILQFPLERRFDTQKVNEALDFIDTLSALGFSERRFTSLTDKYEPLLSSYEKFNRQLKQFLQDRIKDIDNAGRSFSINYDSWNASLESLEYYKYYRNKHKSPSIPYLDERIDEFKALISRKPADLRAVKNELNNIHGKL